MKEIHVANQQELEKALAENSGDVVVCIGNGGFVVRGNSHFNGYSVYVELIDEPAPEITVTGATVRDSVEEEK